MKNKILIFAAIGVGALLLLSGKKGSSSTDQSGMFTLPDGTRVPISQLPSLGYILHEGQWKHQSELTTPDMPANVDPNSPQWLTILNASLQSGSQLYSMSSELASAISRSIKSTAVNWNDKSVTVAIKFGFQVYNGVITPATNVTKTYSDQEIKIIGLAQQVKIKLLKAGVLQKEATIDFATKKLIGFSAGSVGISGFEELKNIDTVTSMYGVYGIGALKGKRKIDTYKYWILNLDTYRIIAGYTNRAAAEKAVAIDYDNSIVITTRQMYEMGVYDPREGIGSIYPYNHPKGLTHCQDGTYSDAAKGACSYHGGAHEIKLRKNVRDYTGKGKYDHYMTYRKAYKNSWAKKNRASKSDRVVTL